MRLSPCCAMLALLVFVPTMAFSAEFAEIASPPPRVMSAPCTEKVVGRINGGTKVEILDKKQCTKGFLTQTWYKIKYKGTFCWISQYVTTGEITTKTKAGTTVSEAPNSKSPIVKK